ncbi:unnamed protein product [Symbiodinium sp. CCMP2592]|nr:unnamed protein product [Symbiodinium sp. CCMP2592]
MDLSHRLGPAAASGSAGALILAALQQAFRSPDLPDFRCPDLPPDLNLRLLGLHLDLLSLEDVQAQLDSLCRRIRVLEIEAGLVAAPEAEEAASSSALGYSVVSAGGPAEERQNDGVLGWERRLEIARDTGNFFRRCLEGRDRRGAGQTKIGLPKRVYVLVRDSAGHTFQDPVRVFFRFSDIYPLVQHQGGYGDSIFAGFASQREAKDGAADALAEAPPPGEVGEEDALLDGSALSPRDWCLVGPDGTNLELEQTFLVLELPSGAGEAAKLVSVIPIVVVGNRLLAALPSSVWHRSPSRRLLPPGALVKPVLAVVAGQPGESQEVAELKVWVAFLSSGVEVLIREQAEEESIPHDFEDAHGQPVRPLPDALVSLGDEHFSFLTAESAAPPAARPAEGGAFERRVTALEGSLTEIKECLATLVAGQKAAKEKGPGRASAEQRAEAKPAKVQKPAPSTGPPGAGIGNLDRQAVNAARAAGISEEHLQQMAKAVMELTKIAKSLAGKKKEPAADFESLLSGGLGDRAESSAGSSRRNSAALLALRKLLRERPAVIYEAMERNLREDFGLQEGVPGAPEGRATARAWLQARSRVQNYTNHVRWMWQLAGIWDCLMQQRTEEARARVALLMGAGEQSSIDAGNWLVSTVSLLEGPPPYQQFAHHSAPAAHELQHSALYDPRWFELFLWQLKEQESFQEARRKLGQRRPGTPGDGRKDESEKGDKAQKAGAKGKAKAKATSAADE